MMWLGGRCFAVPFALVQLQGVGTPCFIYHQNVKHAPFLVLSHLCSQANVRGDQSTLAMARLIVEWGGCCFLDKDKRDLEVLDLLESGLAIGQRELMTALFLQRTTRGSEILSRCL